MRWLEKQGKSVSFMIACMSLTSNFLIAHVFTSVNVNGRLLLLMLVNRPIDCARK